MVKIHQALLLSIGMPKKILKNCTLALMHKLDIGIIGAGQLGMMLIEAAQDQNISFATLDPEPKSSAASLSNNHIVGSLQDATSLAKLSDVSNIITYEIEEINVNALLALEKNGQVFFPKPSTLQLIKNKATQKQFYLDNNIPTAPFVLVQNTSEWATAIHASKFTKFAAKLCTGGYDGKGVAILNADDIIKGNTEIPFDAPCILEEYIPCEKEISIIVARNANGEAACYAPVEMDMDPIANLITYQICPAQIEQSVLENANKIALDVVEKLNGIGLFAIEMFVTADKQILINEMAPRPHNSGHHTIEACVTSQYKQLLNVLLGSNLGSTEMLKPSAMVNIIGAPDFSGPYKLEHLDDLNYTKDVYIHMYNKAESRPGRKLGHITILADTMEALRIKADWVMQKNNVIPL